MIFFLVASALRFRNHKPFISKVFQATLARKVSPKTHFSFFLLTTFPGLWRYNRSNVFATGWHLGTYSQIFEPLDSPSWRYLWSLARYGAKLWRSSEIQLESVETFEFGRFEKLFAKNHSLPFSESLHGFGDADWNTCCGSCDYGFTLCQ